MKINLILFSVKNIMYKDDIYAYVQVLCNYYIGHVTVYASTSQACSCKHVQITNGQS